VLFRSDLDLDTQGRPVILFNTSRDHRPGPLGDPRWWTVAHWRGDRWEYAQVTRSNHNYSTGSLYLEGGDWRIIGPTEPGPQPVGSGGEIGIWQSPDQGKTWRRQREVTRRSASNHNYVRRPVPAHPDFYAFWADGNPDQLSPSTLWFANQAGDKVWRLPSDMQGEFAEPTLRQD